MVPFKGDLWRPTSRKTPRMVVLGSRAALAAAILCASATVASTTVAFTSIPALNLPALQAKRAISPTLREFRLALGEGSGAQATEATSSSHTRRQALQHGVVTIGGIALTMSAGAADAAAALPPVAEELKGYKLVNIFRVSLCGLVMDVGVLVYLKLPIFLRADPLRALRLSCRRRSAKLLGSSGFCR